MPLPSIGFDGATHRFMRRALTATGDGALEFRVPAHLGLTGRSTPRNFIVMGLVGAQPVTLTR